MSDKREKDAISNFLKGLKEIYETDDAIFNTKKLILFLYLRLKWSLYFLRRLVKKKYYLEKREEILKKKKLERERKKEVKNESKSY